MSLRLQILMIVIEIIYFGFIVYFLKKKKLMLSYSLVWLLAGITMLVFTIFPDVMTALFEFLHVESPMNGLLSLSILLIMMIMIFITSIVSKQTNQIRKLTQDNALLEKRIRELEGKNDRTDEC